MFSTTIAPSMWTSLHHQCGQISAFLLQQHPWMDGWSQGHHNAFVSHVAQLNILCPAHSSLYATHDGGAYVSPLHDELKTWRDRHATVAGVTLVPADAVLKEAFNDFLEVHSILWTRRRITAAAAKTTHKRSATSSVNSTRRQAQAPCGARRGGRKWGPFQQQDLTSSQIWAAFPSFVRYQSSPALKLRQWQALPADSSWCRTLCTVLPLTLWQPNQDLIWFNHCNFQQSWRWLAGWMWCPVWITWWQLPAVKSCLRQTELSRRCLIFWLRWQRC